MARASPAFAERVLAAHGRAGADWLAGLDDRIAAIARDWELEIGAALAEPAFALILEARRGGRALVLRLGVPSATFAREARALEALAGPGAVAPLALDPARGAVLLPRLDPGRTLADLVRAGRDDEATAIAADLMGSLRRPAPRDSVFPRAADWLGAIGRARGGGTRGSRAHVRTECPVPRGLLARAEAQAGALLASSAPPVLLHGDVHHDNILSDGRGWRAIDPKGVIAEPAYEAGALLRNPPDLLTLPGDPAVRRARRLAILAERLGVPGARIAAWAEVQAVLSLVWSWEDGTPALEPARALAARL